MHLEDRTHLTRPVGKIECMHQHNAVVLCMFEGTHTNTFFLLMTSCWRLRGLPYVKQFNSKHVLLIALCSKSGQAHKDKE